MFFTFLEEFLSYTDTYHMVFEHCDFTLKDAFEKPMLCHLSSIDVKEISKQMLTAIDCSLFYSFPFVALVLTRLLLQIYILQD